MLASQMNRTVSGSRMWPFAFSALYFYHSSYSLFVICFMVVTSLCWNDNLRFLILDIYTKYRHL